MRIELSDQILGLYANHSMVPERPHQLVDDDVLAGPLPRLQKQDGVPSFVRILE